MLFFKKDKLIFICSILLSELPFRYFVFLDITAHQDWMNRIKSQDSINSYPQNYEHSYLKELCNVSSYFRKAVRKDLTLYLLQKTSVGFINFIDNGERGQWKLSL